MSNHTTFTLSLLERLCTAINESSGLFTESNNENNQLIVSYLSKHKEYQSEKTLLIDRISKLTMELANLKSQLLISDYEKSNAEKKLNKALLILRDVRSDNSNNNEEMNTNDIDLNYLLFHSSNNHNSNNNNDSNANSSSTEANNTSQLVESGD